MTPARKFSHLDPAGRAKMVDVGSKPDQRRLAVAEGRLTCSPRTIGLLRARALPKGDVLTVAVPRGAFEELDSKLAPAGAAMSGGH